MMLVAYFINIADYMHNDHPVYILLNLVGGSLATYASYTIKNWPFVIMEGIWTLVAIWALYIYFKRDFNCTTFHVFKKP